MIAPALDQQPARTPWRCHACGFTHLIVCGVPTPGCPTCAEQVHLATLTTAERLQHRRDAIAALRGRPLQAML